MGAVTSIAVCPGNKGFFVGTSLANRCTSHVGFPPGAEGGTAPPRLVEVAFGKGGACTCHGTEQQKPLSELAGMGPWNHKRVLLLLLALICCCCDPPVFNALVTSS